MPLLTIVALLGGCGPKEGCLDACEAYGIERSSSRCHEICTEDCATLARMYGMNEQQCREMQAGRY